MEEKQWKAISRALLGDLKAEGIQEDFLEITNHLTDMRKGINFADLEGFSGGNTSFVLSPVASVIKQFDLEDFFKLIHKFRSCQFVKHVVMFATEKYIQERFIVPFLEHLAEEIVTLEGKNDLKIVSRKPGGSVTKKSYSFTIENHRILTKESAKEEPPRIPDVATNIDNLGTFKIGLSDQDLLARNRLILPFEKHLLNKNPQETSENPSGKVIYYPEADDDIDEEDPDEDLEL